MESSSETIYLLFSTRDGLPGYVGRAADPDRRYRQHLLRCSLSGATPVSRWIATERFAGFEIMIIFLNSSETEWERSKSAGWREKTWIRRLNPLANSHHQSLRGQSWPAEEPIIRSVKRYCNALAKADSWNHRGYCGLRYIRHKSLYAVSICWIDRWERIIAFDLGGRHPILFKTIRHAIKERDDERERLRAGGEMSKKHEWHLDKPK